MTKKVPMRTCVFSKKKYPKQELIRIVNYKDEIKVDITGKANGRGVYLLKDKETILKAKEKNTLEKVLKNEVALEIYDELIEKINHKTK